MYLDNADFPHLVEVGTHRKPLAQGHMLKAFQDDIRLPDGTAATREYIVHPGAVMVIPLLDDGGVVLERQYRYPMGRVMVEFPAGKLDTGEHSLLCAQRQLLEETGYTAREWAYAGTIHPVISYSTEHIDVWFARQLLPGASRLDTGEFLEVFSSTFDELMLACQSGAVTDAKTLTGAFWWQNVLSGRWVLNWAGGDPSGHVAPPGPRVPSIGPV